MNDPINGIYLSLLGDEYLANIATIYKLTLRCVDTVLVHVGAPITTTNTLNSYMLRGGEDTPLAPTASLGGN